MKTLEQSIHAYNAEHARRRQLQDFEDELQWADAPQEPLPTFYPDMRRISFLGIIKNEALNLLKI